MKRFFKIIEWCFFLNEEHEGSLRRSMETNRQDLISWIIFTVALPLLTYFFAIAMNLILTPLCDISVKWSSIVNNGSLPIAAFGIISSGVPYLMENITNINSNVNTVRGRVMGVATLFMFLTSGLFIFQSISPNIIILKNYQSLIIFSLSLIFTMYAVSTGIKMYLLQSKYIQDFGQTTATNVVDMNNGLRQAFGDSDE